MNSPRPAESNKGVGRRGAAFAVALALAATTAGCGTAKNQNASSGGGATGLTGGSSVGGDAPSAAGANSNPACAAIRQSWTTFLTSLATTGTTAYGKLVDELRNDGQGSQDLDLEDAVSNLESDSIDAAHARLPDYPDKVAKIQQDVQTINTICKMNLPTTLPSPKI